MKRVTILVTLILFVGLTSFMVYQYTVFNKFRNQCLVKVRREGLLLDVYFKNLTDSSGVVELKRVFSGTPGIILYEAGSSQDLLRSSEEALKNEPLYKGLLEKIENPFFGYAKFKLDIDHPQLIDNVKVTIQRLGLDIHTTATSTSVDQRWIKEISGLRFNWFDWDNSEIINYFKVCIKK